MAIKALILTIFVGFFFLIGIVVPKFFSNKEKLLSLTTGITFVIMLFLILADLLPETIEVLEIVKNPKYISIAIVFIIVGFFILKVLDAFVPEHHHEHHEKHDNKIEHNNHSFHIGFITAISLMIHNILEGISIYITGMSDLKTGLLMAISVGCHNLPLGIEIAASMEATNKKKITKYITFLLLILSSFFGAFILFIIKKELNPIVEGILLSLTIGMLLYISIMELLPEIAKNFRKKEVKIGVILGIGIAGILFLI